MSEFNKSNSIGLGSTYINVLVGHEPVPEGMEISVTCKIGHGLGGKTLVHTKDGKCAFCEHEAKNRENHESRHMDALRLHEIMQEDKLMNEDWWGE